MEFIRRWHGQRFWGKPQCLMRLKWKNVTLGKLYSTYCLLFRFRSIIIIWCNNLSESSRAIAQYCENISVYELNISSSDLFYSCLIHSLFFNYLFEHFPWSKLWAVCKITSSQSVHPHPTYQLQSGVHPARLPRSDIDQTLVWMPVAKGQKWAVKLGLLRDDSSTPDMFQWDCFIIRAKVFWEWVRWKTMLVMGL